LHFLRLPAGSDTQGAWKDFLHAADRVDWTASRLLIRATLAQNKYIFEEKEKALFAANRRA